MVGGAWKHRNTCIVDVIECQATKVAGGSRVHSTQSQRPSSSGFVDDIITQVRMSMIPYVCVVPVR